MSKERRLSDYEIALTRMPPINTHFPIVFKNGSQWSNIRGGCSHCKTMLPDENLHGKLTWPLPTLADIEGLAWCETCKVWSHIRLRCRDDLTLDGPSPHDGTWKTWKTRRSFSLSGLLKKFINLFWVK